MKSRKTLVGLSLYCSIKRFSRFVSYSVEVQVTCSTFFYIIFRPDLTYAGFRRREENIRPNDRANLAVAYIDSYNKDPDNLKRALRQCDLAIKDARRFYIAYRIKGYVYFLEKRFNGSVDEYKKAIIYRSRDPYLYNELAGVYYEQGFRKKS